MSFKLTPGELLDSNSQLTQSGWSKNLCLIYNRENIRSSSLRIKEWDYYTLLHPDYGLTITVTDLGIMSLISLVWLDFIAKKFFKFEESKLFSRGNLHLPTSSLEGDVSISGKKIQIEIKKQKNIRDITIFAFKFKIKNHIGLQASFTLHKDDHADSIVVATPWKSKKGKFYYNQKINNFLLIGTVTIGNSNYEFQKENCFGVLDWGRGVWPYKNIWYWSSASGIVNGKNFGFNLGYGFDDNPASENIIFIDGIGHKLDQIKFNFKKTNVLEKWTVTSNDGRCELEFTPILDRNDTVNLLIFKSIQHQIFGYFSGFFILVGEKIIIKNLLGFAEEVYNRW
jgi:hypothetical protein